MCDIEIVKILSNPREFKYINYIDVHYKNYPAFNISNYINVYLYEVIDEMSDNKIINKEVELFKKIIDNLCTIKCCDAIIETCKHLLFYKHKYKISKKDKQMNFCEVLLKYIVIELNLLETIEYKNDLKFVQTEEITSRYNNLELYIHIHVFKQYGINIYFFDKVNEENMIMYYTEILVKLKSL